MMELAKRWLLLVVCFGKPVTEEHLCVVLFFGSFAMVF